MSERGQYVITGVFGSREEAETAARSLRDAGFGRAALVSVDPEEALPVVIRRGLDGLLSGALTGAVLGVALEATLLALPGRGPFGTGGWLGAALAGGIAGGIAGAVVRLGIAELAAERARRRLAHAAALTLRVPNPFVLERVRFALQRVGAIETRVPLEADAGEAFAGGFAEVAPQLRALWQARHARTGARWEEHEPRYRYGWQMANRPDFAGRTWNDAEGEVGAEWITRHPGVKWALVREQVAHGWLSARNPSGIEEETARSRPSTSAAAQR